LETVRVDITYRPLRICWAVSKGDMTSLRSAMRTSFSLWGGRFNPIVIVEEQHLAEELISTFLADVIVPVGDSEQVQQFPKKFPHLITPFFPDRIFLRGEGEARSQALDVYNALAHANEKPEWEAAKKNGLRLYSWSSDDPLADVFLAHFGEYCSPEEIHIDYRRFLKQMSNAEEFAIDAATDLPDDLFEHPSISFVSRLGLERHYLSSRAWDTPGFFSGRADDFDDLVCFWNLRAADVPMFFVDARHLERYGDTIARWGKAMREMVSQRRYEFDRTIAVWVRDSRLDRNDVHAAINEVMEPFRKEEAASLCRVGDGTWNGLNVHPPTMYLGEVSTLGVVGGESENPRVSFALQNKPFNDDHWFHTHMLIASLSFIGGLYGNDEHLLVPPFIPELNEFYARTMHFEYNRLRSEPNGVGLVIGACDTDAFIRAMYVPDLIERVFDLAGFSATLSTGGLIARQLITQLGGVEGARAFKIPGVRRLLKTHGPMATFTKKNAMQLIACRDPENPTASFKDYENLYGDHHPYNTELKPQAVFAYLVERGLFRMGAELKCPHCRMKSWTALDVLKQKNTCEMCGRDFDSTYQLVDGNWHFRRSGVLGLERNAQGAVPVVLAIQQLKANLSTFHPGVYSPSLDLMPKLGMDLPKCEVDFVWVIPESYPDKTIVVIGECKDRGDAIDATDIKHLKRVADAFPAKRFSTYIILAKLCPFSEKEVALARTLNDKYHRRVILLTDRELEPYHLYERTALEFRDIKQYGSRPEDWANNTDLMYFRQRN
jgi:hypothetical protein